MTKTKKNVANMVMEKKPKPGALESRSTNGKQDVYDPLIKNGSSDESCGDGDGDFANYYSDSDSDEDSDDGFSERESDGDKNAAKRKSDAVQHVSNANPPSKKKKTNKVTGKVKAPTLAEINELKETQNLFHSNLFRLQVKEMIEELKIKQKYVNYINEWLDQLNEFLQKLESEQEKEDVSNMQWLSKCSLQVPLALKELHVKKQKTFQFQFIKPTKSAHLIGAAATNTLLGPSLVADICIPMPAECFQKENYLNLVYDQKRAYYLTYIANAMLQNFEGCSVDCLKFNYYANNPLKAVLEVTPNASNVSQKLLIRLFVAADENSFKLSRFVPWNNNIRSSLFDDDDEESVPLATPSYNANVLFDLTMQQNQQTLKEVFNGSKNLQEGLVLLKVWLQQRQLNMGYSAFPAHILAMFVAYLVKQRKLHLNMSSYQVARTVWNQLAFSAWDESDKGISLCSCEPPATNQPTLQQFHTSYAVVFIDVTGFHNICANVSLEMYRRVRQEAKLAVDMLNDMKLNSFQLIFMTKYPLYTQFDHIIKFNKANVVEQILQMHVPPAVRYDYAGYSYPQLLKVVTSLLRKGLGKRVHTLLSIEQPNKPWNCQEAPSGCAQHLHLGLILNVEHALEVLDKGPESIADGAEEFRRFWGDKAQLRRFQDGSITESVVWATTTDTLTQKRSIVRSIVLHLLQHHFQLEPRDVDYVASELDLVYKLTSAFKVDKLSLKQPLSQDTDSEALSLPLIHCFDDLARKLHGLNNLPLEIVSIAGISPVFRYCEPTPQVPQARSIQGQFYATQVHHGIIQLGLSGKWPGELGALRALKVAFYIQISKLLLEKHRLRTKVTNDGLLVLKQGYCFAVEIAHPKEVGMLKKEKTEQGITKYVDCPESIALEKRHYIMPKVTGALHGLYQLHPSFGGTAMIAKRWLYSQLIDDGIWPDECTELLIAAQYLKTHTSLIPSSPQTGFIRFIHLLAHTDWKTELFVLNFNNAMDENELSEFEQRFRTERDTFPPLCIATAYDLKHYGNLWSSQTQPNVHVLARVSILARETLSIIESSLLSVTESFIKTSKIFTASSKGYDLVIQLKPDLVPNTLAFEFGSPFVPFGKPNFRLPLAGINHLKTAVEKLREAYSDFAAFFYNPCGGKEIGVIWKPQIFAAKDFKVTEVSGYTLSASGNRVQCQKEVLIEDFKFILKDFYLHIDTVEAIQRVASKTGKVKAAKEIPSKFNRYFPKTAVPVAGKSHANEIKVQQNLFKNRQKVKQLEQKVATKANESKMFSKIVKQKDKSKSADLSKIAIHKNMKIK